MCSTFIFFYQRTGTVLSSATFSLNRLRATDCPATRVDTAITFIPSSFPLVISSSIFLLSSVWGRNKTKHMTTLFFQILQFVPELRVNNQPVTLIFPNHPILLKLERDFYPSTPKMYHLDFMLKEMDQHFCTLEVFLTILPVNWLTLALAFPHSGNIYRQLCAFSNAQLNGNIISNMILIRSTTSNSDLLFLELLLTG